MNKSHMERKEKKSQSISVVFPMFNEEDNIRDVITIATVELENISDDYEIVIVNDASTDRTGIIAEELKQNNNRIKIFHHPLNRQLGGSLKTGFSNATKEFVLYSDSDMPFDIAELGKALRLIDLYNADIVAAYRHDRTAEGSIRTFYSFVYNFFVHIFFGTNLRDINFSFKLFRKKILEDITLESEGSFIDAEFMIKSLRKKYRVIQFGVDYFPRSRGVSRLSRPLVIVAIMKDFIKLRYELIFNRKVL